MLDVSISALILTFWPLPERVLEVFNAPIDFTYVYYLSYDTHTMLVYIPEEDYLDQNGINTAINKQSAGDFLC